MARALATSVLVGMQPLLTQVPPRSLRSTTAVFRPSLSRRAHSAGPAWPVPITIASKRSAMLPPEVELGEQPPDERADAPQLGAVHRRQPREHAPPLGREPELDLTPILRDRPAAQQRLRL